MTAVRGTPVDPGDALIELVDTFAGSPLERIRVDIVAVPFRVPIATAAGTWRTRRSVLLTLRDGDGVHGTGEIAPAPRAGAAAIAVLASLAPRLDGLTPAQVLVAIEEDRSADGSAELELASVIEAGLETALLDLAGRRAGIPVAAILAGASGRRTARLRIPVSALVAWADPSVAAADAAAAVARGVRCVKLKVGGEADTAAFVGLIAAVRAAIGDDVELRLDANGAWSVDGAVERLHAAAPHRIAYVEQPVATVEQLAAVRSAVAVPVAADESVRGVVAAQRLVGAAAADVFVVKPARVGGAVQALRIEVVAAAARIPVVLSTFFETGVGLAAALHLAAALPGADETHGIATGDLLVSGLLSTRPRPVDGALDVPDEPGLGVELDPDLVAEFREMNPGGL